MLLLDAEYQGEIHFQNSGALLLALPCMPSLVKVPSVFKCPCVLKLADK